MASLPLLTFPASPAEVINCTPPIMMTTTATIAKIPMIPLRILIITVSIVPPDSPGLQPEAILTSSGIPGQLHGSVQSAKAGVDIPVRPTKVMIVAVSLMILFFIGELLCYGDLFGVTRFVFGILN